MNIIDELTWRGAVNQVTDEEGLRELTENEKSAFTAGPTQPATACTLAI
jgi:Tyrosyl-tRNA synthetase